MGKDHRIKVLSLLTFLLGMLIQMPASFAQNITPATGGDNISADDANGTFTDLTDIIVDETSTGQISEGDFIFEAPSGFEWDVNASFSVATKAATGFSGKGTGLEIQFSSVSTSQVIFSVTSTSDTPPNKPGKATFSGFRIRPTSGTLPNHGNITASGAAVSVINDNYGTIKMVAGSATEIFVETQADGNGSKVAAQDLTAGNSITVYAISRDQAGNFKANVAADSWTLTNKSGLTTNPLTVAGDSKSADFKSTITGSANIQATKSGLTTNTSGTISVIADSPHNLAIPTQPSSTATAGAPFYTQPVIQIEDQYGNVRSQDQSTIITASRNMGSGAIHGDTTLAVVNGIATFSGLYLIKADTANLKFSGGGLPSLTSNDITVSPATADSLIFTKQPINGSSNTALTKPVKVQIIDTYGNFVDISGVPIQLNLTSGSGSISGNLVNSDANGLATFSNLSFNSTGTKIITAVDNSSSPTLKTSAPSDPFDIFQPGKLANFIIKDYNASYDTLSNKTAGTAFDITLKAVDGQGNLLTGGNAYNGTATITSTGNLTQGEGTTASFNNSVLSAHTVEISNTGNFTITAANPDSSVITHSNNFTVKPGAYDVTTSTLSASSTSVVANGSKVVTLTVQLKDANGNNLESGGETVTLSQNPTGIGTLSTVTDNGDGTYTATLTAPSDTATTTLSAQVNSANITTGDVTIHFHAGPLSTFRIEDAGTGSGTVSDQTAGNPFNISITATDDWNNTVTSFNSTVDITSDGTISIGGGTTTQFTNGILTSHSIAITRAGNHYIKVRHTSYSETGQSNTFNLSPAAADENNSSISSADAYLQNDGSDQTTITVQLTDAYGNNLLSGGDNVSLSTTGGTLSTVTDHSDGTYTATLTSGTSKKDAKISGTLNGVAMADTITVVITEFNTWTSSSGGSRSVQRAWDNTSNWSLGSVPTTGQVVIIPTNPANTDTKYPSAYPIIHQDATIDFLKIGDNATVNLDSTFVLNVNDDMTGPNGTFICDRSTVNLYGNLNVGTFASSTCNVNLEGTSENQLDGQVLTGNVVVNNDTRVTGYLNSVYKLTVTSGNTLTMEPGSTLEILGDIQIDGTLNLSGGDLKISSDVSGNNIQTSNTSVEFNGTTHQNIDGMVNFKNLTINNTQGVTIHNDVVVSDTLYLTDGILTMGSGTNLVTTTKSGNLTNIRFLRDISNPGWHLITSPLKSTYNDFLDSVVTQGYSGAYYDKDVTPNDTLQPNVLYFDETYTGPSGQSYPSTSNQRWRAPSAASDSLTESRGLFVYVFGNITADSRYNLTMPRTLIVNGAEFDGDGTEVNFGVTYTAEADSGWNMVGNPYAATVDWDDGNWTKTNMSNSFYVWDVVSQQYETWNGFTGSLGDGLIAPFQGFWVKADTTNPVLKVNEASKTTGGTFHGKKNVQNPIPAITLKLEADTMRTTMYLSFKKGSHFGKDRYDAYRLLPFSNDSYLTLSGLWDNGTQLAIDNLPRKFGKPIEVPLEVSGLKYNQPLSGQFTLSWPDLKHVPDAWTLTLVDQETGQETNLNKTDFYSFDVKVPKGKRKARPDTNRNRLGGRHILTTKTKPGNARFVLKIDPGEDAGDLPQKFALHHNYPNPFNPETTIKFDVPVESRVRLDVFNVLGQRVATLTNKRYSAGYHKITWNAAHHLASGVYLYRMQTEDKSFIKKMTLIK